MATELGIGIIGHQFMGRAHSQAWLDVASFFPKLGAKPAMRMMCGIGYEHQFISQAADLVEAVASGKPAWPDFADGLRCQEVLDAALESAEKRKWVKVKRHKA